MGPALLLVVTTTSNVDDLFIISNISWIYQRLIFEMERKAFKQRPLLLMK